ESWARCLFSSVQPIGPAGRLLQLLRTSASRSIITAVFDLISPFTVQCSTSLSSSVDVRSASGGSAISAGLILRPGTRYSSSVQRPKSINWQRSEQKGRDELSCHSTVFPHV